MRKILITGFNGNLGKRIFNHQQNLPFYCIFLSKYKCCNHISRINKHVIADLSKDDLDDQLWGADEVFHIAGSTHERKTKRYYLNNFEATKRLIDKSEANNVKRFIYVSTQAVGEKGGAYSHSKELAERHLTKSNLKWTIIRPADIYGTECDNAIKSLCSFIRLSKILPIIGDGQYQINPVHVDDFAKFILNLLECNSNKSNFKIYNLAGPSPISFKNFCKIRYKEIGKRPIIVHLPIFLCKWLISIISKTRISSIVPDQVDRLIMTKDNNIELAVKDYRFKPRIFSN